MATGELYAWAIPSLNLKGLPDHTWVTGFDYRKDAFKNIADVIAAKSLYWYCWGNFHLKYRPKGALGHDIGNLELAQCLVLPNVASHTDTRAQGTIFHYGIDGVCHQLANQVLYATSNGALKPLTVKDARGYQFSIFRYGTYGTPQAEARFLQKIGTCGRGIVQAGETMTTLPDEFETHAREVLGKSNPKLLSDLLALRRRALRMPVSSRSKAESLNEQNRQLLDEAAKLLGPVVFKEIFGFSSAAKIDLVDPALMKTDEPREIVRQFGSATKPKASKPITTKVLANMLAEQHQLSKKQGAQMLEDLVRMIAMGLKKGERVKIAGLGILQVRKRAARMGRNPVTGEMIKIKAGKKVAFRAAKDLKEAI